MTHNTKTHNTKINRTKIYNATSGEISPFDCLPHVRRGSIWQKPVLAIALSAALAVSAPSVSAQGMPELSVQQETSEVTEALEQQETSAVSESLEQELSGQPEAPNAEDFEITDGVLVKYNGRDTDVTILAGVTAIGSKAFFNSRIQSVTVPAGVVSIGESAFESCSSLSSISLPTGLTAIKDLAFRECSRLEAVALPEGLTHIGEEALAHCPLLSSIAFPSTLASIGDYAFTDNAALASAVLPDRVASLGIGVFSGCPLLESVTLPQNLTALPRETFQGCASLKTIVIPDAVTALGKEAFQGCASLEAITLSAHVTEIGENAFQGCQNLKIYGEEGSYAQTYAQSQKIPFISNSQPPEPERKQLAASQVSLSQQAYTYNGTPRTPSITVRDGGSLLREGTDYTTAYKNNKNAGTATVTIIGKGGYTGTVTKNFTIRKAAQKFASYSKSYSKPYGSKAFKLNAKLKAGNGKLSYKTSNAKVAAIKSGKVTIKGTGAAVITVQAAETANYSKANIKITIKAAPAQQKIKSIKTVKGRKLKLAWKKDTRADGYQIQYSMDKKFKKGVKTLTVKKNKTISKTISKLSKGKAYYVRVRSYKNARISGKTQKLPGAWSSARKSGKIKK
ncbi:MAG: leucine-rich repeat protein [Lachnospiraceae bacterium]|nr:leucine-rich repeat protein [Lachnospiraceae bacterium]